jgi:hypothetical protein
MALVQEPVGEKPKARALVELNGSGDKDKPVECR